MFTFLCTQKEIISQTMTNDVRKSL